MSWESGSYDAAAAASIGGVLEGVESVEEGDDWVEAEIERLLQGAIDHGEEKRLQNIVHVSLDICSHSDIRGLLAVCHFTGSRKGPAWG